MTQQQFKRGGVSRKARHGRQDGMVLIVALVLLLAMTLAGALLLRSVGAGMGVAGNLGFKQNATSAADRGIEAARTWATGAARVAADFEQDNAAQGYFARWRNADLTEFNPLTYDWEAAGNAVEMPRDENGNRAFYVIHRLCQNTGPFDGGAQKCVMPLANVTLGGPACVGTAEECALSASAKHPYYRITTRVDGPRNTFSYVQVVMF